MFVKYEKTLKFLLKHCYNNNSRVFSSANFDIPRYQLDYLAAKGLLSITPYVNGDPNCRIKITDKGLTYFDEKYEKMFHFWLPLSVSLIAVLISILALTVSLEQLHLEQLQLLK